MTEISAGGPKTQRERRTFWLDHAAHEMENTNFLIIKSSENKSALIVLRMKYIYKNTHLLIIENGKNMSPLMVELMKWENAPA